MKRYRVYVTEASEVEYSLDAESSNDAYDKALARAKREGFAEPRVEDIYEVTE